MRTHLPKDYVVEEDVCEIAKIIVAALGDGFEAEREELHERSRALTERYPLYPHLSSPRFISNAVNVRGLPTKRGDTDLLAGTDLGGALEYKGGEQAVSATLRD